MADVAAPRVPVPVAAAALPRAAHGLVPTGWPTVDRALGGGLVRGVLHEWYGLAPPAQPGASPSTPRLTEAPPLFVLIHLARRALARPDAPREVLWVGRRVWPYSPTLTNRLLARSVFVDPPDRAAHLAAVDVALRSPALAAVVADGAGVNLAITRRWQLAAEQGGALVLLARPPDERATISAAATRWLVRRVVDPTAPRAVRGVAIAPPRWSLHLLRARGVGVATTFASEAEGDRGLALLAWNHTTCRVAQVARRDDPGGGSAPSRRLRC